MAEKDTLTNFNEFKEIMSFMKNVDVLNWMGNSQILIGTILLPKYEKLKKEVDEAGGEFYALLEDFVRREVLEDYDIGVDVIKYPSKYEEEK